MAEALSEVAHELEERRRFISPVIKNLDTGETYSIAEIDKIPKPSISVLSKDARRFDIGEVISKPFLRCIPHSWHPNTVTLISHVFNWILLCVAFIAPSFPAYTSLLFIICAILNFWCMMLDCLDGMHARATGQTSKLGEFLDHWLDALHVPMVGGGIAHALRFPHYQNVTIQILNCSVYAAQLIVYHYQRVFVQTGGVEGQIMTSFFYLYSAYLVHYPTDSIIVFYSTLFIFIAGALTMMKMTGVFVWRFDWTMTIKLFLYLSLHLYAAILYVAGAFTGFTFVLLNAIISWRISGCYVLFSLLQKPYKGFHLSMFLWLTLIAYTHLAMYPIPISLFFSRFYAMFSFSSDTTVGLSGLPSSASLSPLSSTELLIHLIQQESPWTIQSILPYLFMIHVAKENIELMSNNYFHLKKLQ